MKPPLIEFSRPLGGISALRPPQSRLLSFYPFGLISHCELFCFEKKFGGTVLAKTGTGRAAFFFALNIVWRVDYQYLCADPNSLLPSTSNYADFRGTRYKHGIWPLAWRNDS